MKPLHMLKYAFFGAVGEDQFARRLALHKFKRDQFHMLYIKAYKNHRALVKLARDAPSQTHFDMARQQGEKALHQCLILRADYQQEARAYRATLCIFILINLPFNLISAYCITTLIKAFL